MHICTAHPSIPIVELYHSNAPPIINFEFGVIYLFNFDTSNTHAMMDISVRSCLYQLMLLMLYITVTCIYYQLWMIDHYLLHCKKWAEHFSAIHSDRFGGGDTTYFCIFGHSVRYDLFSLSRQAVVERSNVISWPPREWFVTHVTLQNDANCNLLLQHYSLQ